MASKLLMSIIWVRFRSRVKRGVVGSRGGTRGFLAIARSMARPVWCSRPPRDGSRGRGLRLRLLRRVFDRHLLDALQSVQRDAILDQALDVDRPVGILVFLGLNLSLALDRSLGLYLVRHDLTAQLSGRRPDT